MGRALQAFAGHTGMRPGELFALEWTDIDFEARRINVQRRVWKGTTDLPKSNKTRRIVLTSEARDALLTLDRYSDYVFVNKRGNRLSQSNLSIYWAAVKAKAGVDVDFYTATKHFCCHRWYVVEHKPVNAIAQQMGWSRSATEKLLSVYGHGDVGWEGAFEDNESN
jgi:integrase